MSVAKLPPMGWNSWDCYGAAVDEATVRANADYMAKHLKQYGWEYIVVDIQWSEPTADSHSYHKFTELTMDEYSRLIPAPNRFPSSADGKGFKPLADYVHSLGLKFGIHIMRGIPRQAVHRNTAILGTSVTARQIAKTNSICQWNTDMYGIDTNEPGAKEYYESIFSLYASWDVDFIKIDDIANHYPEPEVEMVKHALDASGREMVLSLSPGPAQLEKAEHLKQFANMWRITDDFWDKWELLYAMFERAEKWCIHSGAGHWPDADMLPIGPICQDYDKNNRTKFTEDEQITMLTLWCMMRSPLMIGGEMTGFDDFTKSLLTNSEVLAVLTDTHSAHPLFRRSTPDGEQIAWFTTHRTSGYYLALFHCGETACDVTAELPIDASFAVRDVWAHTDCPVASQSLTASVNAHGARLFYLRPLL